MRETFFNGEVCIDIGCSEALPNFTALFESDSIDRRRVTLDYAVETELTAGREDWSREMSADSFAKYLRIIAILGVKIVMKEITT